MFYFYPFHTCEQPYISSKYIAQPVSATINIITVSILTYFFIKSHTIEIKLLLLSFIAFQVFHAFSHIIHIDGNIQSNIIHIIWYFLTFMIFTAFALPLIIVISYYKYYPEEMKKAIPYLIGLLFILIIVLLNEKFNCELMMSYINLPYHAIIELLGLILFGLLAYIFYKSENQLIKNYKNYKK